MSVESTRAAMVAYWERDDLGVVAEDAVYTLMSTGEQARGREAVGRLLRDFYQDAFEARVTTTNRIVADGQAVWEGEFAGRHIGPWQGIAATGREVRAPLCVVYALENDQIKTAHIYLDVGSLRRQLGAGA